MTLWMRDQENIEKGREIGYELGYKLGMEIGIKEDEIYGFISVYRELNISDDVISKRIQEKYNLLEYEAEAYLLETN